MLFSNMKLDFYVDGADNAVRLAQRLIDTYPHCPAPRVTTDPRPAASSHVEWNGAEYVSVYGNKVICIPPAEDSKPRAITINFAEFSVNSVFMCH